MSAVADIFDRDGDGFIDYYEFVAALHPNKEAYKPLTDADKIEDEVTGKTAVLNITMVTLSQAALFLPLTDISCIAGHAPSGEM